MFAASHAATQYETTHTAHSGEAVDGLFRVGGEALAPAFDSGIRSTLVHVTSSRDTR